MENTKLYPSGQMAPPQHWRDTVHSSVKETLQDRLTAKLLERSGLTAAQFETLLLDQLGSEMANKRLSREEMTQLRRSSGKISRGAFYRTLQQARSNISESIHTILLLGYSGLLESPSLAPYLEASERLRGFTRQLREGEHLGPEAQRRALDTLMDDLEDAYTALRGKQRDV